MSTDEKGTDQEAEAVAAAIEDINDGPTESSTATDVEAEAEIEDMKRHIEELEQETAKLNAMSKETEKATDGPPVKVDENSIYVGQVDYSCTPNDLEQFFKTCGTVNRVTIPINKFNGQPKGFAYVEFVDSASVQSALSLHKSEFKNRNLEILPKRHNEPFKGRGKGKGKGKGKYGKGKGRGRGRYHPYAAKGGW